MKFRTPLATTALALGLIVSGGRTVAAQDVAPPASRDTSSAEKVRADTVKPSDVNARDSKGYRAMGAPENCVPAVAAAAPSNRAPGDTNVTRIGDTLTVAAAPATPDSAAARAAEAAGVYRPEAKPAVPCPAADKATPATSDPSGVTPPTSKGVESGAVVRPDSIVKPKPDSAGAVIR